MKPCHGWIPVRETPEGEKYLSLREIGSDISECRSRIALTNRALPRWEKTCPVKTIIPCTVTLDPLAAQKDDAERILRTALHMLEVLEHRENDTPDKRREQAREALRRYIERED